MERKAGRKIKINEVQVCSPKADGARSTVGKGISTRGLAFGKTEDRSVISIILIKGQEI